MPFLLDYHTALIRIHTMRYLHPSPSMMDAEEHCAVNNIDDDVDTSINGTFNDVDDDHCYSRMPLALITIL